MLLIILITIALFILNIIFIKRSNRKRRYGIFPGRVSLLLVSVLGLYYFFVLITNTNQLPPVLKKDKKINSLEVYQKELNEYMKSYNQKEKNITKHFVNIHYFYTAVVSQSIISLLFSLFGLITIPSRKRFYWITTIAYAAGILTIIAGNWYLD